MEVESDGRSPRSSKCKHSAEVEVAEEELKSLYLVQASAKSTRNENKGVLKTRVDCKVV